MNEKNTKIVTVLLIALAVVLLGAFAIIKLRENGTIGAFNSSKIVRQFNKKYNSKERNVIYYASPTCHYCQLLSPILDTISEDYDMDYYYLDSTKLSNKERSEILKKLEIEKHATPITVIVENGKVVDKVEGYVSAQEYLKFFKENEMIPEDAVYSKESNITYVEIDEYKKIIEKEGTNIMVIGQTTCGHCTAIKPALNAVAGEYDLTIYYINIDVLNEDDSNDFFESLRTMEYSDPDFVEKGSIGTPLVLIVKDGKIKNYFSGERTTSQLTREFTKFGLID